MAKKKSGDKGILDIRRVDQYRTVDDLTARSHPSSSYYMLLILSSLIVASGLLLNNSAVIIGGMIITPVLAPVLIIGLGLAAGEVGYIKRASIVVTKSLLVIAASSLFLALVFGGGGNPFVFDNTVRTSVLYFVVALASGVAAAFVWSKKESTDVLPGIAIAVSLVPPLSLVGIGFGSFDFSIIRFHLFIFLFNFFGVIVGSLGVFSLLKFSKAEKKVHQKTKELEE